tara:strand:- start:5386 stop:6654 length:1269 start_codon:yes stop_codon:yes gene_type:complete
MPVTFNTNNNYDVEIVTEPDVLNPTVIRYSSDTNTPFVEVKITPRTMQYPLLAGNMNFNSLPRFIKHEPSLNVNFSCTPASSPHGINSSLPYEEIITSGNVYLIGTSCSSAGTNMVTTSSQGPFQSERNNATIYGDLSANGVAWTNVVWIEVYEADNGDMINDQITPESYEDLQLWNTHGLYPLITNNVNPQYIRAFVFLEYGPNGPAGLSSNVNIQIDIDEDLPVYGCTDPTATNYDASVTIDDGSCIIPPPPNVLTLPPFTMGHTVLQPLVDVNYPATSDLRIMVELTVDVLPALYIPFPNLPVTYEITELYYIDANGVQVTVERTTNSSLLNPPYGLAPTAPGNQVYVFNSGFAPNIITFPTPYNITLSVPPSILAGTVYIGGVLLPNNIFGGGTPDVYCTVLVTNTAFTASHTEIITI